MVREGGTFFGGVGGREVRELAHYCVVILTVEADYSPLSVDAPCAVPSCGEGG